MAECITISDPDNVLNPPSDPVNNLPSTQSTGSSVSKGTETPGPSRVDLRIEGMGTPISSCDITDQKRVRERIEPSPNSLFGSIKAKPSLLPRGGTSTITKASGTSTARQGTPRSTSLTVPENSDGGQTRYDLRPRLATSIRAPQAAGSSNKASKKVAAKKVKSKK